MCLQENCVGGWFKAFQECVYNTSTSVFLQCFHKVFIHFAKLVHKLYNCFCKVFTEFVQVLLEGFYNTCTCVLERCSQQLYRCVLKGFYNICTCALEGVYNGCTSVF